MRAVIEWPIALVRSIFHDQGEHLGKPDGTLVKCKSNLLSPLDLILIEGWVHKLRASVKLALDSKRVSVMGWMNYVVLSSPAKFQLSLQSKEIYDTACKYIHEFVVSTVVGRLIVGCFLGG